MSHRLDQLGARPSAPAASCHRLPTLSASQALNKQKSQNRHISTGSRVLDNLLADCSYGSNPPPPPRGFTKRLVVPRDFGDFGAENRHDEGIGKGKLTEVCGPPGSGKTAFGIQIAANALLAGKKVTWIETAQPLPLDRLIHVLEHGGDKDPHSTLHSVTIIKVPTLAHILALILHSPQTTATQSFPQTDTAVLVIDNISTLFSFDFPPGADGEFATKRNTKDSGKQQVMPSARRFSIMANISTGLAKLAAMRDIAILVLNQLTTRIVPGVGAMLQPAVGSPTWTNAFTNRLLIFRHDVPTKGLKSPEIENTVRYINILKGGGVAYENENGPIVSITVGKHGIGDVEYVSHPYLDLNCNPGVPSENDSSAQPQISEAPSISQSTPPQSPETFAHMTSPLKSQGKRKREVADSQGQDGDETSTSEHSTGILSLPDLNPWID